MNSKITVIWPEMNQYYERAKAATAALKAAGYKADHIERIDVVCVTISGYTYYVVNLPEIEKYGTVLIENVLITVEDDGPLRIRLKYAECDSFIIYLYAEALGTRGKAYNKINWQYGSIGHLIYGRYISYENMWINSNILFDYMKLNDSIENLLTQLEADKTIILDSEFNPVEPENVNIKNNGCKLVKVLYLKINHLSTITIFGNGAEFIANGKYTYSGRGDLFKYVNEDGEPFALLYDQYKKMTLANSTEVIVLTNAYTCLVECVDGLYDGYKIQDDSVELLKYRDESGNIVDIVFEPYDEPMQLIFRYNDIFFAICCYNNRKTVELNMRKPNSGAKTKAAIATL